MTLNQKDIELRARLANSEDIWNKLWEAEGRAPWREAAMTAVYSRIVHCVPPGSIVVDIGGGIGTLAKRLVERGCRVDVWDISPFAIQQVNDAAILGFDDRTDHRDQLSGHVVDVEAPDFMQKATEQLKSYYDLSVQQECALVLVSTECVEHLSSTARDQIFQLALEWGKHSFISVPNHRLDPEEEHQHTIEYSAVSFKKDLQRFHEHVRVEALGPYLLGVTGFIKQFKLSMTMPVRDEAADIERTLASFRGIADEIVIGVDHRTVDKTREIAALYAEVVFDITDTQGPPEDGVPEKGVHFAHMRNQCIEKCSGDWIFMSEGHERLLQGVDTLLALDQIVPAPAMIGFVFRTGQGQQWAFPWLFRNVAQHRFKRATHNVLDYPDGTYCIQLPQIKTLHERDHKRSVERAEQRKAQNRLTLFDDWTTNENENSLFYLGSEWREFKPEKAQQFLELFLAKSNNGVQRYQARLILAKSKLQARDFKSAREILLGCTAEDWSRTEHWAWLGDLAFEQEKYEEAYQFYRYAATKIGESPFTMWWIDLANYSYLPAQRMAMVCGELGRTPEALHWAVVVKNNLPEDAPTAAFEEADANIKLLREHLGIAEDVAST